MAADNSMAEALTWLRAKADRLAKELEDANRLGHFGTANNRRQELQSVLMVASMLDEELRLHSATQPPSRQP